MRHFTHLQDLSKEEIQSIIGTAELWKTKVPGDIFLNKILAMVFFNPSLRTRLSFESSMIRHGGHAIALEVGAGSWNLEVLEKAIMNGNKPEHIKEAVPVISRLVDCIGVRSFSSLQTLEEDDRDEIIEGFKKYATVPIISMESAREHPCQGLADMLTIRQHLGREPQRIALVWAPHIKPLPRAVPNSFILSAAAMGHQIQVAHPKGYDLAPSVIEEVRSWNKQSGGTLTFKETPEDACENASVVYAKAWGPTPGESADDFDVLAPWMTQLHHLQHCAPKSIFMHCLPVRRNVEVHDAVLDSPKSVVVDEAENRFHIQRTLLNFILQNS